MIDIEDVKKILLKYCLVLNSEFQQELATREICALDKPLDRPELREKIANAYCLDTFKCTLAYLKPDMDVDLRLQDYRIRKSFEFADQILALKDAECQKRVNHILEYIDKKLFKATGYHLNEIINVQALKEIPK